MNENTELDKYFPEDTKQYYDLVEAFVSLTTEDHATAFELSKTAWGLADRWANIASNASKLALMHKDVNKTELKDYCYRKYQLLKYIHEFTRMLWNKGEQGERGR